MNKRINYIAIIFLCIVNFSCSSDDESSPSGGTFLEVTIKTSAEIWGYPMLKTGSSGEYIAFSGDTTGKWLYPEVDSSIYNTPITSSLDDQGNKTNVVYLASTLTDTSKTLLVLYKGESSGNDRTITIDDIVPGTYYVIAFYDYSGGGKETNILNHYDRYAFYTETNAHSGTSNSTPFKDHASSVTVLKDKTTSITLEISDKNWVLGKSGSGMGRVFLTSADPVPTPDGLHP